MSDSYSKTFNELSQLAHIAEDFKGNITNTLSKPSLSLAALLLLGDKLITTKFRPAEEYTAPQQSAYYRVKEGKARDLPDQQQCDIYHAFLKHADRNIGIMMAIAGRRKLAQALSDTSETLSENRHIAHKHNYKNFEKLLQAVPDKN